MYKNFFSNTTVGTHKTSRYVTSHPGQLSLAIPPWVGLVCSWGVNRWIHNELTLYPRSGSVSWCLAEGDQFQLMGPCG